MTSRKGNNCFYVVRIHLSSSYAAAIFFSDFDFGKLYGRDNQSQTSGKEGSVFMQGSFIRRFQVRRWFVAVDVYNWAKVMNELVYGKQAMLRTEN